MLETPVEHENFSPQLLQAYHRSLFEITMTKEGYDQFISQKFELGGHMEDLWYSLILNSDMYRVLSSSP